MHDLLKLTSSEVNKEDVLTFFDRVFTKNLRKLSIQESSIKVDVSNKYEKLRGFTPTKVTSLDFFRRRGKFLPKFEPRDEERIIRRTVKIKN